MCVESSSGYPLLLVVTTHRPTDAMDCSLRRDNQPIYTHVSLMCSKHSSLNTSVVRNGEAATTEPRYETGCEIRRQREEEGCEVETSFSCF